MAIERVSAPVEVVQHGMDGSGRLQVQEGADGGAAFGVPSGRAVGTTVLLSRLAQAAGNQAASGLVQRHVNPSERNWLRMLLTTGDQGAVTAAVRSDAAGRILRLPDADRTDTVGDVRHLVPPFGYRLGLNGGYDDPQACYLISALEGAQGNAALGHRLMVLFGSANPLAGLAALTQIGDDRARAVIQAEPGAGAALASVLTRLALTTVPAHLTSELRILEYLEAQIADPTNAGVTGSDTARELDVEALLTPASVVADRAAAAMSGSAAPTFVEAGYYEDLIGALHTAVAADFSWAGPLDSRTSMDTRPGGHVEGIATEAKTRVDALFGRYGSTAAPALTFAGGNLADQTLTAGNPYDLARWHVFDSGGPEISGVNAAHHAFDSPRAVAIGDEVVAHYSNTAIGGVGPVPPGLDAQLGMPAAERERRLRIIDRMWPGMADAGGGQVRINTRVGANRSETRGKYWGLFKTLVHEYLHTTAHPDYIDWYRNLSDPHHKIAYQEGFTDLFTRKTWNSVFPEEVTSNDAFRRRIQGDDTLDLAAVGGNPAHYPELAEAMEMERLIGLPNMMAAYFRGVTGVLGGGRLP